VAAIAGQLAQHAGLELPAWVVEARALARMHKLALSPPAYVDEIRRNTDELDELLECVRVGETRLFRHKQQIDALEQVVAPALQHRRELRVWSAGCAAGEEAYTLAAVLTHALPNALISVLATDVSDNALARAAEASYPAAALAHVPDAYREDFVVDGALLHVRPELARLVRFERANLIDTAPEGGFDIVWCRNVLIYFTAEARKRAIAHLVDATALNGAMFVGYSESMRDVDRLEPVRTDDAVYYVRTEKRVAPRTPPAGIPAVMPHAKSEPTVNQWREPTSPRIVAYDVYAVRGSPDPGTVTAELSSRLAAQHMRLVVDLDGADMLGDDLAPVFRRAIAAAGTTGVEVELRATKPGPKRWLSRHRLEVSE
jgi:chemotaxis protein methyltransferase CheR